MDVTIRNATLLDGTKIDISIKNGLIHEVGTHIDKCGEEIYIPDNTFVSSGWIDLHTHAFPKFEPYCAHPDDIGYKTGVTTVVDAGSSGADDIDEFASFAKQCKTRVFAYLNISKIGLRVFDELSDLNNLKLEDIETKFQKYESFIVGLKARMSSSVVGDNGIKPLEIGKQFSEALNLPVMVHIGNAPPKMIEVIELLGKGDVITHCFHAKENNNIFSENKANIEPLLAAIERGVYLDVGHGMSSFSYRISKRAKEENIPFHTISTDIYDANRLNGPVYDMATTLMKFLALGFSLEEVIQSVTTYPAKVIRNKQLGTIKQGAYGDLTFFKVEDESTQLRDSHGEVFESPKKIVPYAVTIGGEYIVCTT
ncbi:MAG TPA: amidohydrolase/deacetylase family metallohydrolase [Pseudogracilibacillus sp.]|nr:amidohydrolase/deacetylase family metallohydrolase [Pseudogracilibacillus sp.]